MEVTPVSLKRHDEGGLVIEWSDGSQRHYAASALREACPCATCKEKHGGSKESQSAMSLGNLPVLSMQEAQPMAVANMRPVGNYAYNIAFNDGHNSGIYTIDYLFALGQQVND